MPLNMRPINTAQTTDGLFEDAEAIPLDYCKILEGFDFERSSTKQTTFVHGGLHLLTKKRYSKYQITSLPMPVTIVSYTQMSIPMYPNADIFTRIAIWKP